MKFTAVHEVKASEANETHRLSTVGYIEDLRVVEAETIQKAHEAFDRLFNRPENMTVAIKWDETGQLMTAENGDSSCVFSFRGQ